MAKLQLCGPDPAMVQIWGEPAKVFGVYDIGGELNVLMSLRAWTGGPWLRPWLHPVSSTGLEIATAQAG